MRIADTRGHSLGDGPSHHELQEVLGSFLLLVEIASRPPSHQLSLDSLVDHKVDHSLGDPVVRGCYALVEAQDTLQKYWGFSNCNQKPWTIPGRQLGSLKVLCIEHVMLVLML